MMNPSNANFPVYPDGRTYHVGCRPGEVANRILTVGDPARARLLAGALLDEGAGGAQEYLSPRGFLSLHGHRHGVPVSIIAIGMGTPNMDMMVREVREVTQGPLLLLRLGTCGGIGTRAQAGTLVVAQGAVMVQRNYDHWTMQHASPKGKPPADPYLISAPCPADATLSTHLEGQLRALLLASRPSPNSHAADSVDLASTPSPSVIMGLNATADSFYSSQGRKCTHFADDNQHLLPDLLARYPELESLEMETFTLLHLAQCLQQANPTQPVRAGACALVLFERATGLGIPKEEAHRLILLAGEAALNALVECELAPYSKDQRN